MGRRKTKRKVPIQNYIIVMLFVVASFKVLQVYGQHLKLQKQVRVLEQEITKEKKQQKELQAQKAKMNTNQYYENFARQQLNLVKPGEIIFIDQARAPRVNP